MLDYRGLEALHLVRQLQSFEAAARRLHITQSAVSQRIKALETHHGAPLLIRSMPLRATALGEQLLRHYQQVAALEASLQRRLGCEKGPWRIVMALNRDSLESWFLELLKKRDLFAGVLMEIWAGDQELTLDYFKEGSVAACLSTSAAAVGGGCVAALGSMEYVMAAAPSLVERHFPTGDPAELLRAPAIKFDSSDFLHERYLEKYFALNGDDVSFHVIPSVRCFKQCALEGYGYALLPLIDIAEELRSGAMVALYEDKRWSVPLYWHYWDLELPQYRRFNQRLIREVRGLLC